MSSNLADAYKIRKELENRNRLLGRRLRISRETSGKTQAECAAYLDTSRQRYGMLESGAILVSIVEYEAVMKFLSTPPVDLEKEKLSVIEPTYVYEVPTSINPGEILHLIIKTK